MIPALDRFLDTRQKRYSLFSILTMGLGVLWILPYLRLSYSLVTLSSYQDAFLLLEQPIVKQTYLSRIVVACLSYAQYDMGTMLNIVIGNIRGWEIVTTVMWMLFLSQKQTRRMRRSMIAILVFFLMSAGSCVLLGLQATTLLEAIHFMKLIGMIVAVCGMIVILLCAYQLIFIHIPRYYEALQYEVEEY